MEDSQFFLCLTLVARRKTSFFKFFTELKTYYIPHSIYFRIIWTFQFRFIIAYTQELRVLAVKHL